SCFLFVCSDIDYGLDELSGLGRHEVKCVLNCVEAVEFLGYQLLGLEPSALADAHEPLQPAASAGAEAAGDGLVRAEGQGFVGVDGEQRLGPAVAGEVCDDAVIFANAQGVVEDGGLAAGDDDAV